jgi:uncharacterized protein YjgD (DUF1641 family)
MTTVATPTTEERLERLSEQVAYLVEDAERRRLERDRWSDLAHDAGPIARLAMDAATEQFESLDVDLEDLARFAKTTATALPRLEALLAQLDSMSELAGTAAGLAKPAMDMVTARLTEADEKGYFNFAKGGLDVVDHVVTSFTEDDVKALGENIVLILNTVKDMTQPEVMTMLRRTINTVQGQEEDTEPPSLFALLRDMREPEVRRGLSRLLAALRSMGQER